MLILTRKSDESIMLNDNIEIKVLSIEDGKVKIGIEAPKSVDILRKEIYEEVEAENRDAANLPDLKKMEGILKKT